MKSLLFLCYVFHAIIVFCEEVQYQLMGAKVTGLGGGEGVTACSISEDGNIMVIGQSNYDGVNG